MEKFNNKKHSQKGIVCVERMKSNAENDVRNNNTKVTVRFDSILREKKNKKIERTVWPGSV